MTKQTKPKPKAKKVAPKKSNASAAATPTVIAGKLGEIVSLLKRPQGASLAEMMTKTGWQAHSVRGALSGALKKVRGLSVTSEATQAGRVYRIVSEQTS